MMKRLLLAPLITLSFALTSCAGFLERGPLKITCDLKSSDDKWTEDWIIDPKLSMATLFEVIDGKSNSGKSIDLNVSPTQFVLIDDQFEGLSNLRIVTIIDRKDLSKSTSSEQTIENGIWNVDELYDFKCRENYFN